MLLCKWDIVALILTAKIWKQAKYIEEYTLEWIKKMQCIYTTKYDITLNIYYSIKYVYYSIKKKQSWEFHSKTAV